MSLTAPLFLKVLVGNHREGEGVMIGCCCTTPAGFGRLRWTTDDEARGRSVSSTVGSIVICMIVIAGTWKESSDVKQLSVSLLHHGGVVSALDGMRREVAVAPTSSKQNEAP